VPEVLLLRLGLRRGRRGQLRDLDLLPVARQAPPLPLLLRREMRRPPPDLPDPLERLAGARELEVAPVVAMHEVELALALEVVLGELDLRQAAPGELLQE